MRSAHRATPSPEPGDGSSRAPASPRIFPPFRSTAARQQHSMAETAEASKPPAQAGHSAPRHPGVPQRRSRLRRWVLGSVAVSALAGAGMWIAVHRIPWMGPLVANGLRSVIGAENVTALEETAYSAEDRVHRLLRSNEPPKTYWEVPEQAPPHPPPRRTPRSPRRSLRRSWRRCSGRRTSARRTRPGRPPAMGGGCPSRIALARATRRASTRRCSTRIRTAPGRSCSSWRSICGGSTSTSWPASGSRRRRPRRARPTSGPRRSRRRTTSGCSRRSTAAS